MTATARRARGPRVLFLSGLQIHPTLSGGNLRSFALANALQRHGLEVFVYSLVGRKPDYLAGRRSGIQTWPEGTLEYVDRGPLGFLAQYGSYALSLPPLWITGYLRAGAASPGEVLLPRLLREKLAECDVVLADFPFVHPVFRSPSARGALRVLSTHNLEHQLYDDRRWRNRRVRPAVREVERKAAEDCDLLVSCCDDDRRFFEANARVHRSILVPNGIDARRFAGLEAGDRARMRRSLGIPDDVKAFLFTASKYGPNREAFEYLIAFARSHAALLAREQIHILVVGNVTPAPVRLAGFTATGRVDAVEPYFAAADAALNPMWSGGGTNVKICEFLAARLPILTTRFGARGFRLEDGETAFLFERDGLWPTMATVRRLFDADPGRLRRMAEEAYVRNQAAIDMDACVAGLAEAMWDAPGRRRGLEPRALLRPYRAQETPWVP